MRSRLAPERYEAIFHFVVRVLNEQRLLRGRVAGVDSTYPPSRRELMTAHVPAFLLRPAARACGALFVACAVAGLSVACGEPELPALVPYRLRVRTDAPELTEALAGARVLNHGVAIGELGHSAPSIEFEAPPPSVERLDLSLEVRTPCGFRALAFDPLHADPAAPRHIAEDLEEDGHVDVQRRIRGEGGPPLRHVYVVGAALLPVRVGEVELPRTDGEHAVLALDCEVAPVRAGDGELGTWSSSAPVLVQLDPDACVAVSRRGYGRRGAPPEDRLIRGRGVHALDFGPRYERIEHVFEPTPETMESASETGTRRSLQRTACPSAPPPEPVVDAEAAPAQRDREVRARPPARPARSTGRIALPEGL
jgi:hypothetical protein